MSGGGSTAAGETRYNWNEAMEPRWTGLLDSSLRQNMNVDPETGAWTPKPRSQYDSQMSNRSPSDLYAMGYNPGQIISNQSRVAPLSRAQQEAQGGILDMTRQSSSPVGSMRNAQGNIGNNPATGQQWGGAGNNARLMAEDTLGGRYLQNSASSNANANMFAGLGVPSQNPYIGGNPYRDANTQTDRNAFAGENPYFDNMLQQSLQDTTNAYQQGTAADTRRMMNMAGAFGGSAHQQMQENNEAGLGRTLANQTNALRNQQYDRSAGMEEQYLGRDLQNQQYNRSTSSGLTENEINRGNQNFQSGIDRGFQGWENERGRQMQGIGFGQNEQGLAFDRANQLMNSGQLSRGYQQSLNDEGYGDWTDGQNWANQVISQLAGLYGGAQGGSPMNSQLYQSGASRAMPYLGAGLSLAGLFGGG